MAAAAASARSHPPRGCRLCCPASCSATRRNGLETPDLDAGTFQGCGQAGDLGRSPATRARSPVPPHAGSRPAATRFSTAAPREDLAREEPTGVGEHRDLLIGARWDEHGGDVPLARCAQQSEHRPVALGDVVAPEPTRVRPGRLPHRRRAGPAFRRRTRPARRRGAAAARGRPRPRPARRRGVRDREHRPVPGRDEDGGRREQPVGEAVGGAGSGGLAHRRRARRPPPAAGAGAARPLRQRRRRASRRAAARRDPYAGCGRRRRASGPAARRSRSPGGCRRTVTRASSASVSCRRRASAAVSGSRGVAASMGVPPAPGAGLTVSAASPAPAAPPGRRAWLACEARRGDDLGGPARMTHVVMLVTNDVSTPTRGSRRRPWRSPGWASR